MDIAKAAREAAKRLEQDADGIDPMNEREQAEKDAMRVAATGWLYFAQAIVREERQLDPPAESQHPVDMQHREAKLTSTDARFNDGLREGRFEVIEALRKDISVGSRILRGRYADALMIKFQNEGKL